MDKPNHEKIYLVPDDGVWCWSDTPAPGAGQSNADAVEYVRADLFNQMQAERDALAATVEALREHASDAAGALGFLSHHLRGRMGEAALMDMAEKADALNDALTATPQQHLAEVKAQAVDDAVNNCLSANDDSSAVRLIPSGYYLSEKWLNQYAEQIRKGEVEQTSQQETELQKAVRILGGVWPADERWSSNRFIYLIHHPAGGGYATTDSENNPNYKYICTRAEFEQAAKRQSEVE